MENLGTDFDKNVLEWRDALDSSIQSRDYFTGHIYIIVIIIVALFYYD